MSLPRCIGYGPFDSRRADPAQHCQNPADANRARLWCRRCEALRVAAIDNQMAAITKTFEEGPSDQAATRDD